MCSALYVSAIQNRRTVALGISEACAFLIRTLGISPTTLAMVITAVQLPELFPHRPATPRDILVYLCRAELSEFNKFLMTKIGIVFKQLKDADKLLFFRLIPVVVEQKCGWITPLQLAALCNNSVMFRAILAEIYKMNEHTASSPLSVQMEMYKESVRADILALSPLHLVALNANDSLMSHVLNECLCNDKTAKAVARSEHTLMHAVKEVKRMINSRISNATKTQIEERLKNLSVCLKTFYQRVSRESEPDCNSSISEQLFLTAASSFYSSPSRCSDSPSSSRFTPSRLEQCI